MFVISLKKSFRRSVFSVFHGSRFEAGSQSTGGGVRPLPTAIP